MFVALQIKFHIKGSFRGQKERAKTISGAILCLFYCYYSWLAWPAPPRPEYVGFLGPVGVVLHSKYIPDLVEQFFGFGSGIHFIKRPFWLDIT